MQAVNRGELDAFIADSQVANFYIVIADGAKEFMPAQFLYSAELRPAVAKDNMRLLSQIDEGFTRLTTSEKTEF